LAGLAFALALWRMPADNVPGSAPLLVSIALSFAALLIGAEILMWVDRHWQTWAGLAAGLVPVIFFGSPSWRTTCSAWGNKSGLSYSLKYFFISWGLFWRSIANLRHGFGLQSPL